MIFAAIHSAVVRIALIGVFVTSIISASLGQVGPDEITNPKLKQSEQRYLLEMASLNKAIGTLEFPASFRLARYIEATSGPAALDSNGIEFVKFRNQLVLKISGIYGASFDSQHLNQNDRVIRVFEGSVVPMLRMLAMHLPRSIECDGIGFEVIYGVHHARPAPEFEGRDVLSLILSRDDAFTLADEHDQRKRQQILDRSDAYVSGKSIVIRLDAPQDPGIATAPTAIKTITELKDAPSHPGTDGSKSERGYNLAAASISNGPDRSVAAGAPAGSKTDEAIRLQEKFGTQVKAVIDAESLKLHPDSEMAPQFENEADQICLHFTVHNAREFDGGSSSIYKRAARSFDLFLAPELRSVVNNLPKIETLKTYHFSVLNTVRDSGGISEVIDYICPVDAMRSFVENQITSQQLIDRSVVLVNGVRIGVNLQLVE